MRLAFTMLILTDLLRTADTVKVTTLIFAGVLLLGAWAIERESGARGKGQRGQRGQRRGEEKTKESAELGSKELSQSSKMS
jgi:hypothetical protein